MKNSLESRMVSNEFIKAGTEIGGIVTLFQNVPVRWVARGINQ
jgi:hypothetical protein